MNFTHEYEYSKAIWKYTPPVIIIIGTFGHILTIIAVNYQSKKATSFSVYLTSLAVVDLAVLYTVYVTKWLDYGFGVVVINAGRALCKIDYFLDFSLTQLSSWIVMCLTGERVYCIYSSKNTPQLPGSRVGQIVLGNMVLFLSVLNAHQLYGRDLVETPDGLFCGYVNSSYMAFFFTYWSKMHFVVYFALPAVVIVFGHSAVVVKMYRSARELTGSAWISADKRARQVLIITILISAAYIILASPLCLLFIFTPVRVYKPSHTILYQMLFVNHAINFWLYVLSGSRFRNDLKKAFRHCFSRKINQEITLSGISFSVESRQQNT